MPGPSSAASARAERRPSALAALTHGDFRLLLGGLAVSNVGTWMQTYALGWYVVQLALREGTPGLAPLYVGLVGASRGVPVLLVGLIGGTVSDRVDRRRLLVGVQTVGGTIALILAALELTGHLGLVPLIVATALTGVVGAFDSPARLGIVPSLVPARALTSAIGLMQGTLNLATILGPLIGGVLIASVGVGGLLLCNAASFAVSIGAIVLMQPLASRPAGGGTNVLRSMRDGFTYVWRDHVVGPLFLLLVIISVLARPMTQLLPAVAEERLHVGALELSWLLGAAGAGAFVGSIVSASLGALQRPGFLVLGSALASGALLVLFARQDSLIPALLFVAATNLAFQMYVTNHVVVHQSRASEEIRGRVIGASFTFGQGSISIGSLLLGALGTLVGIDVALAVAGGILFLACLATLLAFPQLRNFSVAGERRHEISAPAVPGTGS